MEVVGVKSVVAHVAQAVAYTSRYSSSWILSKNVRVPEVWLAITGLNGK